MLLPHREGGDRRNNPGFRSKYCLAKLFIWRNKNERLPFANPLDDTAKNNLRVTDNGDIGGAVIQAGGDGPHMQRVTIRSFGVKLIGVPLLSLLRVAWQVTGTGPVVIDVPQGESDQESNATGQGGHPRPVDHCGDTVGHAEEQANEAGRNRNHAKAKQVRSQPQQTSGGKESPVTSRLHVSRIADGDQCEKTDGQD